MPDHLDPNHVDALITALKERGGSIHTSDPRFTKAQTWIITVCATVAVGFVGRLSVSFDEMKLTMVQHIAAQEMLNKSNEARLKWVEDHIK